MQLRTEHIMFDQSIYKEGLYNIDIFLTKTIKTYMKAVNPFDVKRNKKLLSWFIGCNTNSNDEPLF